MEKTVRIIKEYKITIPDKDIPDILVGYREVIDPTADEDSLFKRVAFSVNDDNYFVEGIGTVLRNGVLPWKYRDKTHTKINTEELGTEIEVE